MTNDYSANNFSRTALLLAHELGDPAGGVNHLNRSEVSIVAGPRVCATRTGHAALLTAVKTAVRAFGTVSVALADPSTAVLGGPESALSLADAVSGEGARLVDIEAVASSDSVIVLGDCPDSMSPRGAWLTAYWTGWTAAVVPTADVGQDQVPADGNVLAAIAAGALAIAERFFGLLPDSEVGVGRRSMSVDLWASNEKNDAAPPELRYCPAHWWLLGWVTSVRATRTRSPGLTSLSRPRFRSSFKTLRSPSRPTTALGFSRRLARKVAARRASQRLLWTSVATRP